MALISLPTNSSVETTTGANRTFTAISPMILIRVGTQQVGAIQNISFREERQVQTISEVGSDAVIDSTPIRAAQITGQCRRIRYDRLRAAEAFSRGFLHAKSQRIGFDIDIYDKWAGDNENMIVTTIKNVWITGIDYEYASDNYIITDNMSFIGEDISSSIQGQNAATGGTRGLILQTDTLNIERQTDRGLRRGALDAAGLINAVFA